MATRHRTASADVEGLILGAALRLLDAQGLTALTVRGIAAEAGIAPMGIYNRFEGKMGVFEALWVEGFERLTRQLEAVPMTDDPRSDLLQCGRVYRNFALDNRAHYRLMFMVHYEGFTPSAESALVAARSLGVLITVIEAAQRAGQLTDGAPIELAQIVWAAVHGFVALELIGLSFCSDVPAAYERLLAATCNGLAAAPR